MKQSKQIVRIADKLSVSLSLSGIALTGIIYIETNRFFILREKYEKWSEFQFYFILYF